MQVFTIHGGEAHASYEDYIQYLKDATVDLARLQSADWKKGLQTALGEGWEALFPRMPSHLNAKYPEWELWFKKLIPLMQEGVILIGHSLGGTFLAKFLSENDFPKKITATFLLAPPYSHFDFSFSHSLEKLQEQGGKIFLYYSKDDHVVDFSELSKYQQALPNAKTRVFDDKGHFNQGEFPELVADIKNLHG